MMMLPLLKKTARVIPHEQLIPKPWLKGHRAADFLVYNPAITRFNHRLLMACRIDSGQRSSITRRIALCELDKDLNVLSESVVPFSDTIRDGGEWHYDPRFLVHGDRLFIHYNNNFQTIPNQIHLVELDPDTLRAKTAAQPLQLEGSRQTTEKNWMLFEHEEKLYAIYSIAPHRVLRVHLSSTGPILCQPVFQSDWDVTSYANHFGIPRGGAPPVRSGQVFLSFFHSRRMLNPLSWVLDYWPVKPGVKLPRGLYGIDRRLRQFLGRSCYFAGLYAFEARPPFKPLWMLPEPVIHPRDEPPRQIRQQANPSAISVVYPCGVVSVSEEQWLVSYGLHDERCCLTWMTIPAGWSNAASSPVN